MKLLIISMLSLITAGITHVVVGTITEVVKSSYATLVINNYVFGKADVYIVYDNGTMKDLAKEKNIAIRNSAFSSKNFPVVANIIRMMEEEGYSLLSHAMDRDTDNDMKITYLFQKH